ncbi:hypothetical protein DFA_05124 [Cavenderia fasciculata]|uniref:Transmembrane protein n=1 Tax=Cavenderia fasciculata TaxID=261658 RepID=F4PNE1_CACFS|nr:uncharacterized protein DFA_05124 [Cavenderia fasciculata]EGG22994.1 hypothetical protein DFA_05124 [Cavenderia fasciculata]|eukprot:XP_004360845.1 hypothetical protein DFA_05124 [Cavenderia fasciculata]
MKLLISFTFDDNNPNDDDNQPDFGQLVVELPIIFIFFNIIITASLNDVNGDDNDEEEEDDC